MNALKVSCSAWICFSISKSSSISAPMAHEPPSPSEADTLLLWSCCCCRLDEGSDEDEDEDEDAAALALTGPVAAETADDDDEEARGCVGLLLAALLPFCGLPFFLSWSARMTESTPPYIVETGSAVE